MYNNTHTHTWLSLGPPVSSTNKIDHQGVTEILLKVALNIIKPSNTHTRNFGDSMTTA